MLKKVIVRSAGGISLLRCLPKGDAGWGDGYTEIFKFLVSKQFFIYSKDWPWKEELDDCFTVSSDEILDGFYIFDWIGGFFRAAVGVGRLDGLS